MTERSKKFVNKSTKKGKRSKRHRTNSKNAKSPSSSKKHSTSSTMNDKASPKTRKEKRNSSVSIELAVTSGSDSMAYDSTTDTSLQTLSIESDDYSQMSAPQSPCDPADDGKESRINEETLRWNGFSEDPAKEEKRLEIYKANRRQRYYELAKARAVGSRYYAAKVENIGQ